jgi:hypothetical protein
VVTLFARKIAGKIWENSVTGGTYPVAQNLRIDSGRLIVLASGRTQRMARDKRWDGGPCRSRRPIPARDFLPLPISFHSGVGRAPFQMPATVVIAVPTSASNCCCTIVHVV